MAKLGYFKRLFSESHRPTLLVNRGRFVGADGNQLTVAGAKARGVSQDKWDPADSGDSAGSVAGPKSKLNITLIGIEEVEAAGVIAPNARVTSTNDGRALTVAVDQAVNGIALNDVNSAAGDFIPVLLVDGYESPADTSGATLANLEIEVNKLKAAFRSKLSKP